eukprot:6876565-Pyramimonas_sp.AAC.1
MTWVGPEKAETAQRKKTHWRSALGIPWADVHHGGHVSRRPYRPLDQFELLYRRYVHTERDT